MKNYCFLLLLFILAISCQKKHELSALNSEEIQLYSKLEASETGVHFKNELPENIKYNGLQYEYYYNGSGLAVADFNNDGLKDLFFVSALKTNKMFLNQGNLKFLDASKFTGILNRQKFSGGIAIVDINNDGWLDIYISNSGKFKVKEKRKNKLYINQGAKGAQKIPTFKEESKAYGLDLSDCSTQAAFFDYDKDGDLDMYLLNHYPASYPLDKTIADLVKMDGGVSNDRLLRNDNNYFTDISKEAGIIHSRLEYGLGVGIGDVNNDGWPDIYVSTDYTGSDHLYINNKKGGFTDKILESTNHTSFFAMGNDIGDINNDGWLDFMAVDMMGESNYDIKTSMSGMNPANFQEAIDLGLHQQYMFNTLQINTGKLVNNTPRFYDIAQFTGISKTDWSWAPLFLDMDNDGYKDIFVSNGIKRDFRNNDFVNYVTKKQDAIHENKSFDPKEYVADILTKMPTRKKANFFFKNQGDLKFKKMNATWGDSEISSSNGAVYADLDNDGDLEIIVNNTDDPAWILKNNAIELGLGHYVRVQLKGEEKNSHGIGARVKITTVDGFQVQELYTSRGFMSSTSNELHFGLGKNNKFDIEVVWPDAKIEVLKNMAADQLVILDYKNAKIKKQKAEEPTSIFNEISVENLFLLHQENPYNDFERESLLPHKMSQEGPAFTKGDVNGDQLEDVFIGGAKGEKGQLLLQQPNGSFKASNTELLAQFAAHEDVSALFLDIDQDSDLDLYVVSGGNEYLQGSPYLKDRLYLNNGEGIFTDISAVLPHYSISGSCVRAADYDKDGDLDLFIGGRQVPGQYPASAKSYVLVNESKKGSVHFRTLGSSFAKQLQSLGMVTDALWVDINKDNYLDLVVTGEWMPIHVFENTKKGNFIDKTTKYGFKNTNGWWYSLAAADIDNDGDMDLIGGNLGLNYKYKASNENPFEVFASDFDKTGTHDIVLSYYEDNNLVPLRGRECSSNQMPFIKAKFPTYDAFGKAKMSDIFNKSQLENSIHKRVYNFASSIFINNNGVFKGEPLPNQCQLSSINDILIEDFNNDQIMDLLLAGNLYGSEVETPRNDASYGQLLLGDGKGGFKVLSAAKSGLLISGEIKQISPLLIGDKKNIVFVKNNAAAVILSY